MSKELDAKEVEHLTLQEVGIVPKADDRRQHIVVAIHLVCDLLDGDTLVALGIFKDVYAAETFLSEVLTDNGHQIVEMLLIFQLCHLCGKVVKSKYLML